MCDLKGLCNPFIWSVHSLFVHARYAPCSVSPRQTVQRCVDPIGLKAVHQDPDAALPYGKPARQVQLLHTLAQQSMNMKHMGNKIEK